MADKDEDPLVLKSLAVNFDYLMYKINDHISNLSEKSYNAVSAKQDFVNEEYLQKQLNLERELQEIDEILNKCNELELDFMRLDQLYLFVEDFKSRLDSLEHGFKEVSN
mmetsp:Transcript_8495/g.10582  ORF Transcript_8495/g.10582 Transcript_8495/m.10582 type:complete len:109 (-) Transcript_8495:1011-1337(-)